MRAKKNFRKIFQRNDLQKIASTFATFCPTFSHISYPPYIHLKNCTSWQSAKGEPFPAAVDMMLCSIHLQETLFSTRFRGDQLM